MQLYTLNKIAMKWLESKEMDPSRACPDPF